MRRADVFGRHQRSIPSIILNHPRITASGSTVFKFTQALLAAALWLGIGIVGIADDDYKHAELVRVYYDFEVASYCGLVTNAVGAGFQRNEKHLLDAHDLNPEQRDQARMKGWTEAHLEWQNRGLGGFKGWCRTEGREAAERFSSYGAQPR